VLTAGGKLFVAGALGVASTLGMSEGAVGMTIVALGTSLPELAASVVAAVRGFSGIAVGNVVGSNIFNVFLVLGAAGLVAPIPGAILPSGDDPGLVLELAFLIGMTVIGAVTMRFHHRVTRWEGCVLFAAYATFIVLVVGKLL
jgi:cation:H+ antiporter